MEGRHVHPSTLYPGGVARFLRYRRSLITCPAYDLYGVYEGGVPLHDDLFDFMYEALPGYEKVGNGGSCSVAGFVAGSRRL